MNNKEFELQHDLSQARERIAQYTKAIGDLQLEVKCLREVLQGIGDYAHERSTGPAVPDPLWEVREMAYDAL